MTAQQSPPPPAETKSKQKPKRQASPMNPVAITCWGIIVLAILFVGYSGYSASQTGPVTIATPTPTPTVVIPSLSLHQNYERQGPVVTVNPNQIGKPNPFQ